MVKESQVDWVLKIGFYKIRVNLFDNAHAHPVGGKGDRREGREGTGENVTKLSLHG